MSEFVPYRRRIQATIRDRITSGQWPPGHKLPTTDELAAEFEVGRSTVRAAVTALIDAGVLYGHMGRGVYVADRTA